MFYFYITFIWTWHLQGGGNKNIYKKLKEILIPLLNISCDILYSYMYLCGICILLVLLKNNTNLNIFDIVCNWVILIYGHIVVICI